MLLSSNCTLICKKWWKWRSGSATRRVCWGAEVEELVKNGVRRKGKRGMLVMDDGDYEGGTLWFLTLWLSFDDKGALRSWVGEEEYTRSRVGGAFHFRPKVQRVSE